MCRRKGGLNEVLFVWVTHLLVFVRGKENFHLLFGPVLIGWVGGWVGGWTYLLVFVRGKENLHLLLGAVLTTRLLALRLASGCGWWVGGWVGGLERKGEEDEVV